MKKQGERQRPNAKVATITELEWMSEAGRRRRRSERSQVGDCIGKGRVHLKRILRLDRLRLRVPNGAHDEFLLAATAQNLRKLAKLIPMSASPVPV